MKDKEVKLEETEASHTLRWIYQIHLNTSISLVDAFCQPLSQLFCLLLIDKARAKDKTSI